MPPYKGHKMQYSQSLNRILFFDCILARLCYSSFHIKYNTGMGVL